MLVSHNHCSGHLNIPIFAFQLKQRNKNVDLKIIYFGIIIEYKENLRRIRSYVVNIYPSNISKVHYYIA